ncbi:hypothetical protein LTR10_005004 [Elasticomyces elasticus]|nr:hypothetical protein LTR10_005004 [Elasticomyces elasticus]KAK4975747.1 hypothetical protein LTR42_003366 [Elasticomyces elasticus]
MPEDLGNRSRHRLSDLDGRLKGILEHLTAQSRDVTLTPETSEMIWTPADTVAASQISSRSADADRTHATFETKAITQYEGFDNELTTATASWIGKLGLDHHLLDPLLEQYREIQHFFPFVVVMPDWTSRSMMHDRPFLLLAAVANVASHYPRLQDLLAKEIKDIIAEQIVIAGETSLDLLSGLLVHIAW